MKRIVSFILILAMLFGCARVPLGYYEYEQSELIALHEKIGDTIDHIEREAFGLFPEIEDFQSARFRKIDGQSMEITIETKKETFISINRDSMMIAILFDYIENYEMYENSKQLFEKKWGILDYDTLGIPITLHEVQQFETGRYPYGCGFGMFFLGFIPSIFISAVITGLITNAENFSNADFLFGTIFIVSEMAFISTGITIERKFNQFSVVQSIKKSREPRLKEKR